MEKIYILVADEGVEIQDAIFSCLLKDKKYNFLLLMPASFDDLFREPFLNSSLAVIDFGFSGDRGLEALKSLKTFNPSMPVIFTTSQSTEELCLKAFNLGARSYFKDPIPIMDIINIIELILKSKKDKKGDRSNILLNQYANGLGKSSTLQKIHPGIEKAKSFVEENFSKNISLDLLAKIACKSKFHFCRIFKKQAGMTATDYLNLIRVRKAKNFLKND